MCAQNCHACVTHFKTEYCDKIKSTHLTKHASKLNIRVDVTRIRNFRVQTTLQPKKMAHPARFERATPASEAKNKI